MSSKKITDADKLEIARLYRLAGDTTASLASRFGVSNSTISRLLKNNIPGAEYELLIQQKRGSKVEIEEESTTDEPIVMSTAIPPAAVEDRPSQPDLVVSSHEDPAPLASTLPPDRDLLPSLPASNTEEDSNTNRRVRRRSSAPLAAASDEPTESNQSVTTIEPIPVVVELVEPIPVVVEIAEVAISDAPIESNTDIYTTDPSPKIPAQPPIPRTPALREILSDSKERYSNPPAPEPIAEIFTDELEEDLDSDSEDVNALAAMFGEEIADGDDDDEFAEEDWDEEPTSADEQVDRNQFLTEDRLNVQVTPLSKATLPRTCYIVIDKFAELIVRPLKDFADLGQISGEEIQQRTLPVFDNHRVAKRFSNQRTQRVIKVPDSRVFYKTTQQLRSKGITCLLVDGNIYSLN